MFEGLRGRVALVTGGSSGIGKATVRRLAQEGVKVAFCSSNPVKGRVAAEELRMEGLEVEYVHADVSKSEDVKNLVSKVVEKYGKLDIVFCNAGIHSFGDVVETSEEELDHVINVDFKGAFLTLKYAIPEMVKSGGGSIILMGSDQTFVGKPKMAVYGAMKAAIGQLTKSTAIDFAKYNIRVNRVCHVTIDTPLIEHAAEKYMKDKGGSREEFKEMLRRAQPMERFGKPEEVASLVCFLASDEAGFMTGSLISIDGGYTAQ
ncbi:MAG: SDR family NAD(P)-dependent oxidoreductase [Candidatus Bathyarchaeia archaeon]